LAKNSAREKGCSNDAKSWVGVSIVAIVLDLSAGSPLLWNPRVRLRDRSPAERFLS
jgi:hypothetical protein